MNFPIESSSLFRCERLVSGRLPAQQVLFVRSFFWGLDHNKNGSLVGPNNKKRNTQNNKAYLESLDRIPLAEAVFIGKIHPVSAAILSYLCLGETLSVTRALGILVSFLGVTLISKPSWEALVSGAPQFHLRC